MTPANPSIRPLPRQAVKEIGHTLLVLQPWNNPRPLTRCWCLWEVLCTIRAGSRLEVAMGAEQEAAFHQALTERFEDIMARRPHRSFPA